MNKGRTYREMNWSNLTENKCPMCGTELVRKVNTMKCGKQLCIFAIGVVKYENLVSDLNHDEWKSEMGIENNKFI